MTWTWAAIGTFLALTACGARTGLGLDAGAEGAVPPGVDAGSPPVDGGPADAGLRFDAGAPERCEALPVIQLVADPRPLAYPSIARRREEAMLVYTVTTGPAAHEIWSRTITPLGEDVGPRRPVAHGLGGRLHGLHGVETESAFLLVYRTDDLALFTAELFEEGGVLLRRMRFPSTSTIRPAVAASDSLVVFSAPTDRGIETRFATDGSAGDDVRAGGRHVSAALVPEASNRVAQAIAFDGHVHVEVFNRHRAIVFEERSVAAGWDVQHLSVAEGPDAPVAVAGVPPAGGGNPALLFDRRGETELIALPGEPSALESAWAAGWHVAALGIGQADGHHVIAVAAEPVTRGGRAVVLDLAGPFAAPVHPAIMATGEPAAPFLVVWAHLTARGGVIEGRIVGCDRP